MSNDQNDEKDEKALARRMLKTLEGSGGDEDTQEVFGQAADQRHSQPLQDDIMERYSQLGSDLLSDTLPQDVDPRIAGVLDPIIGDTRGVKIHTGKMASEAARAMDARAFAIGDKDIFFDQAEFSTGTPEGRTLIAHELAHTRDAATGFALSSRGDDATSAREDFAHQVEAQYAASEAQPSTASDPAAPAGSAGASLEKIDKVDLERRVFAILQSQERRNTERMGR